MSYHFETLQLHVGQEQPDPATGARAVPIYQTTSYVFRDCAQAAARFGLTDAGNIYGRLTNSTQDVLEQRVAALEGGVAALATASGAAAVTYTIQALARQGDHIVAQKTIYGGTYNLLAHTLPQYGITATFVDAHDAAAVEAAIQPNTRAVYLETLGNPNCDIPNIEAIAAVAHRHGLPLVIDNTFGTPYWVKVIPLGADIVVHSATKFLGGHGTTLGGIIVIATYLLYYIGVTGGASNAELIEKGATVAFTNIFGNVIGNFLNLFIAISCIGTMNGLMLACCRGVYSVAARGKGPATHMFSRVDEHTNMPNNSAVMGLLLCGFWGLYFYLSNLAGTWSHKTVFTGTIFESVPFLFDPTELPIITIYALYIPVFIQWIRKQKGTSVWQHYILPILAICGSVFMVIACLVSHGMGCFWYLIVFAFVMVLGGLLNRRTQRTVQAAGA